MEAARDHLAECLNLCRGIGGRREAAYGLESAAGLAETLGEPERAARLQGAAAALREAIGHPLPPSGRADRERLISEACAAALGEPAFESAFAAGFALSWEQAIADALRELEPEEGRLER